MAQYESIKIDKSLYNLAGKTFTQALEALDPSAAYKNTELADLDAFQRQLKRFDIKVSGAAVRRGGKIFHHCGFRCAVPGVCGPGGSPGHGGSELSKRDRRHAER